MKQFTVIKSNKYTFAIIGPSQNIISEKQFANNFEAVQWANNFITSFQGISLTINL
jgi:hypothetical protein